MSSTARGQIKLQDLFTTIDNMDAAAFADFLTDDAQFRFGSSPVVKGKEAIAEAVAGFFGSIAAVRHQIDFVTPEGDVLVAEGTVCYTRHNKSQITLPFVNVFALQGSQIANYKIYIDIAPLYAE